MTTSGPAAVAAELAVAILAGGKSRRMGCDKALLPWDGATLLGRTVALAGKIVGAEYVAVIGRARPGDWQDEATTFLEDDAPGDGPLPAIAAALRWAEGAGCDAVLVLSCDLPLLTAEALQWLADQTSRMAAGDSLAVCGAEGRIEPLFSIYSTRCREAIAAQLSAGRRSPTAFIEKDDFWRVHAPLFVQKALTDVDTPEDFAALTTPTRPSPV